ncbi:hypothetical protein [Raineyella fluvialis]|uniref:Uncharacterized protein n=1 Tax=Raineyella fluvialis TaxID=2662261 RepID=A0A5Q2FKX5_9ACTN|nr:hypothetical protein [Raineyella fluvialis]QGF24996.1 hypothetical protein Rai3103_16820 [Raineyella fluvialis]
MTDFLSQQESRSARVDRTTPALKAGLDTLIRQLGTLEADNPLIVLIGTDALNLAHDAALPQLAAAVQASADTLNWVHIPHCSRANGQVHHRDPDLYRQIVARALAHPRMRSPWRLEES